MSRATIARIGAALVLLPALGGALVALLRLIGLNSLSAGIVMFVAAVLVLVTTWRFAIKDHAPGSRAALSIAFACVAGTLAFPLASEWWRIYSDNWTHAMIVRAVVERVPPIDPGFAGVRLQYAWIYHAFVASLNALTGADVYLLMSLIQAAGLASVVLGAAAAIDDERDVPWTLVLLLLGLNALFFVFTPLLVLRAFLGEVRGTAELARQFDLRPLQWDTTGVFLRSLSGQDFFLDKFMVVTPFGLSIAALVSWAAAFRRFLAGSQVRELMLLALFTLAAGLMHPVTGVFLGASIGLAAALAFVLARAEAGRIARAAGATIAGLVPVVLYTKTVIGGAGGTHSELPFDLAPFKLLGYATCLALGLLFAAKPLAQARREPGAIRGWALWVASGLVVALVSRLPGPTAFFTVDKLSYLVWIPLALTAGPAFASWMRARNTATRIALALLLFVPVNGLALASRVVDPHNSARMPFDLPGFVYLREKTPKDAVLLVQLGDWESAGFGERDQYTSRGHPAVQFGYDEKEIEAREDLERRLFATGRLESRDFARLAGLGRPVYVVWADFRQPMWARTPGTIARAQAPASPRPAFDPSLPLLFTSPELEVRRVPLP